MCVYIYIYARREKYHQHDTKIHYNSQSEIYLHPNILNVAFPFHKQLD